MRINNSRNTLLHLLKAHYPTRLALEMINQSRQSFEFSPARPVQAMIETLLVTRRLKVLPQPVEGHIELMA
jgi:hypothetical protein